MPVSGKVTWVFLVKKVLFEKKNQNKISICSEKGFWNGAISEKVTIQTYFVKEHQLSPTMYTIYSKELTLSLAILSV